MPYYIVLPCVLPGCYTPPYQTGRGLLSAAPYLLHYLLRYLLGKQVEEGETRHGSIRLLEPTSLGSLGSLSALLSNDQVWDLVRQVDQDKTGECREGSVLSRGDMQI